MKTLVFLVEGPSEESMLNRLIPRVLKTKTTVFETLVFEGKRSLEKKFVKKIQSWQRPGSVFLILVDQDAENCRTLKKRLSDKCKRAKIKNVVIRIACRELESWYLGDFKALKKAFRTGTLNREEKRIMRQNPDEISKPAQKLEEITGGEYQKTAGSRKMGLCLDCEGSNRSRSFNIFVETVRKIERNL